MRDYKLKIDPFTFINLLQVTIDKEVDKHSSLFVRGTIAADKEAEYVQYSLQDAHIPVSVTAFDDIEQDQILFHGVVTGIKLEKVGGVSVMEITGRSGSYLLDITPHFRTFQNVSTVCSEVFDLLGENYVDYHYILKNTDDPIHTFTVQYNETDWHFIKRMAHRTEHFIVPADTFPGIRFYMGMPELHTWEVEETVDFTMQKNNTERDKKRKAGLVSRKQSNDEVSYIVKNREVHSVGDIAIFHGMKLHIHRVNSKYDGQELVHTYTLKAAHEFLSAEARNESIIGASLDAQVVDILRDRVQIKVFGDENAEQEVLQWFLFSTVYSSPDGTGWYCMPEINDLVRLYFSDKCEENAVVFNATHAQSPLRNNPDIKFMRNKYGKEVRFTPNTLIMTNNKGMEISIIDDEGIFIESDQMVSVRAEGNIDISTSAGVSMQASDSIVVQQGGTSLQLDDNISFTGGKLLIE